MSEVFSTIMPADPLAFAPPFRATPQQISHYLPGSFDDMLGNEMAVNNFKEALLAGGRVPHTLVTGPSRTGKTALVKLFLKILLCKNTFPTSIRPCGQCEYCNANLPRDGQRGIESNIRDDNKFAFDKVHVITVDCSHATDVYIKALTTEVSDYDDGLRIFYLDEVHRLGKRGYEELFLKPMEERSLTCIATSTKTKGLEPAFLARFGPKLHTEPPTRDAMSKWLARRCVEWMLTWDDPKTLVSLAEVSSLVPGIALNVLSWVASTQDRVLTADMVDHYEFAD